MQAEAQVKYVFFDKPDDIVERECVNINSSFFILVIQS